MTIDRISWLWRKGRMFLGIGATLFIAGLALNPLQSNAWTETRSRQPEMNVKDLGDSLGQGTLLGVLGGFRNILADFVWIRGDVYWEQRDRPNTEAMIHLATTLDPRVLLFWDSGSRMIALDIPAWSQEQNPPLGKTEIAEIYRTQARRGLDFLDRGLQFHPGSFSLLIDKAMIYQNQLHDLPDAAEQYRLAAQAPNSPFFAASIYVRQLGEMNRGLEAYQFLRQFYPTLPNDAPDEQKGLMYVWIRAAEDYLHIPTDQRMPGEMPPNYVPDKELEGIEGVTRPKS